MTFMSYSRIPAIILIGVFLHGCARESNSDAKPDPSTKPDPSSRREQVILDSEATFFLSRHVGDPRDAGPWIRKRIVSSHGSAQVRSWISAHRQEFAITDEIGTLAVEPLIVLYSISSDGTDTYFNVAACLPSDGDVRKRRPKSERGTYIPLFEDEAIDALIGLFDEYGEEISADLWLVRPE